jgi:hypothetical protein
VCTDPACYRAKIQALVQARIEPLVKEGQRPVQISSAPCWQARSKSSDTLYEGQYRRAERERECSRTQVAVVVDGREAGTILHICAEENCKTHRQFSHYEISPQEREQRRKLALAIRVQKESRSRILQAVRQKLPGELARANFEMVALDYFRRLGHDNHHRLFQVYGWEEKKTKTSWGGTSVDHEKLAEAQIRAMTTADLNRFCELRACPRFVLPCLQFRGGSVERSQPHANRWPLQDRRVQSHHNNHKRFFEKAEKQCKERKRPGGKERRSERAVRT